MDRSSCPVCAARLHPGLDVWHLVCPACSYEAATLTPNINNAQVHSALDEKKRAFALKPIRQRNFQHLLGVLQDAGLPVGARVLEVGSGYGWFLEVVQDKYDVQGLEPDAIVWATSHAQRHPVRCGYFPVALQADERFDAVVFNDVFEHIPDIRQVLRDCSQHLKPGGVLLINLPSSRGFFYKFSKMLRRLGYAQPFERMWQKDMPSPHLHYFDLRNLDGLLERNHFRVHAEGVLPSVTLKGLFQRVAWSGDQVGPIQYLQYFGVACLVPFLRWAPSDIVYILAHKAD